MTGGLVGPVIIPPIDTLRLETFWNFTFECALFNLTGDNSTGNLTEPDVTLRVAEGPPVYSTSLNTTFNNETQLYDVILNVGEYLWSSNLVEPETLRPRIHEFSVRNELLTLLCAEVPRKTETTSTGCHLAGCLRGCINIFCPSACLACLATDTGG